ncbi:unnamed protein product, partial [marine sediment metagenome]
DFAGDEDGLHLYTVDGEMADAVQEYLDYVRSTVSKEDIEQKRKIMFIEEKFDLSWLYNGIFGSNDCGVFDPETKALWVTDYKNGQGIVVEPEWNTQLLTYALGAMYTIWMQQTPTTRHAMGVHKMIETVHLTIVQPRAWHPESTVRTWTVAAMDVLHWGLHVFKPAALATEDSNALLRVGAHCKKTFCPAIAICPEQMKNAYAVAKVEFGDNKLPNPADLSALDITKVMDVADVFATWAKEVKVFAQHQMEVGVKIPGYKLVKRKADRKWISTTEA